MPITLDRGICCDLNETISREWLITNGVGGYASGTVAGALTRMQHGLLIAPLQGEAIPRLLLAKIDEEVVFDQRTYYPGTNEYQDGTLNPAGFGHLETFRLEEGFPVFTYRLGGIDGITLEKRIWMPYGLNTTYIQYRVLHTDMPQMSQWGDQSTISEMNRPQHIIGRPGIARRSYGYGRSDYTATENRSLALTLLPFTAYRPNNTPQYGNLDWQFQVQTHQPVYGTDESDLEHSTQGKYPQKAEELKRASPGSAEAMGAMNRPLQLPQGVTGCTIRAWEGASPYSILIVGHPESGVTFIPTGVWYWHFLRRHQQAAGLPAIDDLYLPGVFRAKLWPGEGSTLTIIVTSEELSSLTFNDSQIALSRTRVVEHARSFLQPERYFGDGGETVRTLPVLPFTPASHLQVDGEEFLQLLLQAADRFVARRPLRRDENARNGSAFFSDTEVVPVIIPGYYDMQNRTRETLIALPGLTLATRRYADARSILRSLARHLKQGLLPDRLPTDGQPLTEEDYGSVDTTLWFFNALDHYLQLTQDYPLLDDLYSRLVECISEYGQGTYNGIRVDAGDGLLQALKPGKALTWMNAVVDDKPVTPRYGKPVEVNALWYNALCLLDEWTQLLYQMGRLTHTTGVYAEQGALCKLSFNRRFWLPPVHVARGNMLDTSSTRTEGLRRASLRSADSTITDTSPLDAMNRPLQLQTGRSEDSFGGYLYDVIDGTDGNDTSFRPNQLLALSLRYAVLDEEYHSSVMEQITRRLVTPYGLRTLAPEEEGYQGQVKENVREQRMALHQGSCWPWLIGPYVDALLRLEQSDTGSTKSSRKYTWRRGLVALESFRRLSGHGMLGMVREVYVGDATGDEAVHTVPCGEQQAASAISTGELLRVYKLLAQTGMRHLDPVFSV
jgi:glycogen debranching enzyme